MLKGKLKLPETARKVFTGRIVRPENEESKRGLDLGEELEILPPHGSGFGSDKEGEIDPLEEQWEETRVRNGQSGDGFDPNLKCLIDEDEKRSDLEYELSQDEVNLEKLQRIASTGIPDGGSLRATTWKVLLGYLPPSRDLWDKVLSENRSNYAKLREEFLLSPSQISNGEDEEKAVNSDERAGPLSRHDVSDEDHPLSLREASVWNRFFEHTEIAEQIDRDLERTHPELRFFSGGSSSSKKHKESMKNILLLFAKLNPTTRYVQGMNEVLAPMYYVFSTDAHEQNAANAEADSFACFVRLLSDSVDHFCQQLDNNSSVGIHSTLARLMEMLKANDDELWRHLEFKSKVNPQFYAFRWITLLLTQEFPFNTVLRIWDSLLSDPAGVQDMLLRVCCAMLLCVKSQLMEGDFAANLYLLQHYPKIDIKHILQVAGGISPDISTLRVSL
uniref:Rab-GAP TBC domain-containing protein n=1 Tax=Opuntia streptacantha TaxID=393608 RepID=A0A7C9EIM3_OPUST